MPWAQRTRWAWNHQRRWRKRARCNADGRLPPELQAGILQKGVESVQATRGEFVDEERLAKMDWVSRDVLL